MKYIFLIVGWFRCIIRLGPLQAFKLIVLAPRMNRPFLIHARGYEHPIQIRGKSSDDWVLNSIIVCREYSGFISKRPARILDGGANIGLADIYWSQLYPGVEIVAIEPDPDNFELLQRNTEHLENVSLIQGGIWSRKVKLRVEYPSAEKYAIRVVEDENGTIEAHSIDSIMSDLGWDWIDVVKLDVEGSEVAILSENIDQWIDKIGTLIIEIHQDIAPKSARVLFQAFAERDFHLSWRGENLILRRIQRPEVNVR